MKPLPNLTLNEFKELVTQLYDEFEEDFHDAVLDFSSRVYNELGDRCYLSQMYHILIGSTPDLAAVDIELNGELSTQQFVFEFPDYFEHNDMYLENFLIHPSAKSLMN